MTDKNGIAGKLFAAFGAVVMTAALLVSSFAVPTTTAFAGVLA